MMVGAFKPVAYCKHIKGSRGDIGFGRQRIRCIRESAPPEDEVGWKPLYDEAAIQAALRQGFKEAQSMAMTIINDQPESAEMEILFHAIFAMQPSGDE